MAEQGRSVQLAGSTLDRARHACAFFHDLGQEYRLVLPFVKEGFARKDKIFPIVDRRRRDGRLRRIGTLGIDTAAERSEPFLRELRERDAHPA